MATEHWIPEPTIFLVGCQAWPPPGHDPDCCPVCGSGIRPEDMGTHCGWCDSSALAIEDRINKALARERCQVRAEGAQREANAALYRQRHLTLSEIDRRRVWNGYRHSVLVELTGDRVTNLAKAGRDWLIQIGQVPDWSIKVVRVGHTWRVSA